MEVFVGSLIFDGLLVFGGSVFFLRALRRRRRITRTPTTRIADAPGDGVVEIKGRVVAGEQGPVRAPVTGRSCVWVRTVVTESQGKRTTQHVDQTDFRPFRVEDDSGQTARVFLEGAVVDVARRTVAQSESPELLSFLAERNVWRAGGNLTCDQEALEVGDSLYAIGPSRREVGPPVNEGYRSESGTKLVLHAATGAELFVSNKTEEALVSSLTWRLIFFGAVSGAGLVMAILSIGRADVLSRASHPSSLTTDDAAVYWTNSGTSAGDYKDGSVVRVPLAGGSPTTLASHQNNPVAIAVHGGNVYWASYGSWKVPYDNGAVLKVPAAGGAITTIAAEQRHVTAIAVSNEDVYWTASVWDGTRDSGVLMKARSEGGIPVTLASGPASGWRGAGVAVDEKNVYWTTSDRVMKAPLRGGTAETLVSGQKGIGNEIVVDAANAYYWAGDSLVASVMKVPTGGGAAVTLTTIHNLPAALAVGATDVYLSVRKNSMKKADADGILSVPLGGGPATHVYDHVYEPGMLALKDGSVIWSEADGALFSGDGRVVKLTLR